MESEEALLLEDNTLSSFVDFSDVLVQKFDSVKINGDNLILYYEENKIELAIKDNTEQVSNTISKRYLKSAPKLAEQKIILSELRDLPVIDFVKQTKLKDYIDDLVFSLYFVPLEDKYTIDNVKM